MISALKLFQEHTAHVVLRRILIDALMEAEEAVRRCNEKPDEEIEALSLCRAPLSDMPRPSTSSSPTERVAERMEIVRSGKEIAAKRRKLHEVELCLQLYDSILPLFTEKEQWFIEHFFLQKQSMVQIVKVAGSPFEGYDRTTVWRFKKRLLEKADRVLEIVYEQRG